MSWSTMILGCADCSDCGFCCLATWCGCIAYGMNTALMTGHTGSSKCGCIDYPESCQCQYCGEGCRCYVLYGCEQACCHQDSTAGGDGGIGRLIGCCCAYTLIGPVISGQLKALGINRGFYPNPVPTICLCFDEPCCLSTWCAPCMLTRIHSELVHNTTVVKPITYKGGVFTTNTMFHNIKII